jgi:hypothetical protein
MKNHVPSRQDGEHRYAVCRYVSLSQVFQLSLGTASASSVAEFRLVAESLGPKLGPTEWPVPHL